MDRPNYLGYTILELSKLPFYETYHDNLQPYFEQDRLQLHYIICDSVALSIETQNFIDDPRNLENLFDFSDLNENHQLLSNTNEKVLAKFYRESPKNNWIEEFIALRSKVYSFICNDKNINALKGISNFFFEKH